MKTIYALILLAVAHVASAQTFTIKSYTIGAPGGTSTGDGYAIKGSAGEHDAADFGSRTFVIGGGFWKIAMAPKGPKLRIVASGRSVLVAWPDPSTGFQLQQSSTLNSNSWNDLRTTPRIVGAEKQVLLPLQATPQFFRLRKESVE